jgi:hypothetical protein
LKDLQTPLIIANGFEDVIDGSLANSISFDEKFNSFLNVIVWTNTNANGGALATDTIFSCGDWSGDGVTAIVGDGNKSDESWTDFQPHACFSMAFLYCFQK